MLVKSWERHVTAPFMTTINYHCFINPPSWVMHTNVPHDMHILRCIWPIHKPICYTSEDYFKSYHYAVTFYLPNIKQQVGRIGIIALFIIVVISSELWWHFNVTLEMVRIHGICTMILRTVYFVQRVSLTMFATFFIGIKKNRHETT